MKISVENLGVLQQAEFELGDLTLICGSNNTGKSYATYALYGFLLEWSRILEFKIQDSQIKTLVAGGTIRIDIESRAQEASSILTRGCRKYTERLSSVFASKPAYFRNSSFQVGLQPEELLGITKQAFDRTIRFDKATLLSMTKTAGETDLIVSLLSDTEAVEPLPRELIKQVISDALNKIVFGQAFPTPFIASAERTGAAIFRRELNFARNRLLEEMTRTDKNIDPIELLFKSYQDYALPVKANADFIRQLEIVANKDSFIAENHRQILDDFSNIIGGEYLAASDDTIYFKPMKKSIKLTMDESSSAVRSLLDIGFYLRHQAKEGDLLMVDEPELNLHPENQRRVARLFARLINLGIKIFITTHSDYIVKELNTLIMLNQDKPHLKRVAEQEGYKPEEFIRAEKIRVYIAKKDLIKLKGNNRRSQCQTLIEAEVDSELGIEALSFDRTINEMNDIQDAILWGED